MPGRTACPAAISFLEHLVQVRVGRLERGHETEEQASREGNATGKDQHRPVEPEPGQAREILRLKGEEEIDSPAGEHKSKRPAEECNEQAFEEQQPNELDARCADLRYGSQSLSDAARRERGKDWPRSRSKSGETRPTAPNNIQRIGRTSPTVASVSEMSLRLSPGVQFRMLPRDLSGEEVHLRALPARS